MTAATDFASILELTPSDVAQISERAVTDPQSRAYAIIKKNLGSKLAAYLESKKASKKRGRVYIQHAVSSDQRYELVKTFPQFDIKFSAYDKQGSAVGRAVDILIVEYMLTLLRTKKGGGDVVIYGASMKTMLMRNRHWVHMCFAGSSMKVQQSMTKDDAAVQNMVVSMIEAKKNPLLAGEYINGRTRIHCTIASECKHKSLTGVANFSSVDTNFRQVAQFMLNHEMRVLYFAIVATKEMELGIAADIPELDAYTFPSENGSLINVSYKNDSTKDMAYLRTNYLEMIARTSVVLNRNTYHKEFVGRVSGMAVYKVTRLDAVFDQSLSQEYKSWVEPAHADKYMCYVPTLKDGGVVENPAHWSLTTIYVQKSVFDDVLSHAMRADTPSGLAEVIKRRLHTRVSNFLLQSQVVVAPTILSPEEFKGLAYVAYTHVFMRKFSAGTSVSTLAPYVREAASLSRTSTADVAIKYAGMIFGNVCRTMGFVSNKVINIYRAAVGTSDVPMPVFSICPGFITYSQSDVNNPWFSGWNTSDRDFFHGFSNQLPKPVVTGLETFTHAPSSITNTHITSVDPMLFATGEAIIDDGKVKYATEVEKQSFISLIAGNVSSLFYSDNHVDTFRGDILVPYQDQLRKVDVAVELDQKVKPMNNSTFANDLASRIVGHHDGLVRDRHVPYVDFKSYSTDVPILIDGPISDDPIALVKEAIMTIFPMSLIMNTQDFEEDAYYGSWDRTISVLRLKLGVSGFNAPKPESFYLPMIRGHHRPDVKNTLPNTFAAVAKRNADAPKNAENLDVEFLVNRAVDAMFQVFYRPGAKQWLIQQPNVGPTYEAVKEWITGQDESKLNRLDLDSDQFSFPNLIQGSSNNHLMIKTKLKPSMSSDYQTAVKQPQTIQYDPTGKVVAVYSPVIAEKVAREQSCLKPNILVLQGKSIDDLVKFLNSFDWRPDQSGNVRTYLEGDYTMYDKSQGQFACTAYLTKCEIFGVLPVLRDFLDQHSFVRTVSAMKAHLKIWLSGQNSSGAPYTLDRNNDVNMLVSAELLLKISDMIEFMVFMGDDFIVALRGNPDISGWEEELSRKYNLSIKLQLNYHGYVCSYDIVHLPDGNSLVVPDVIKRAIALMNMSVKDEEKFEEQHISYSDNMKNVGDPRVAQYLASAYVKRYSSILPHINEDAVVALCKAHNTFRLDYTWFRKLWSENKYVRFT